MRGEHLKMRLRATGKTMTEICELVGVTTQAMASTLKVNDVRSGTLERLCSALGVKMNYFYEGTEYAVMEYPGASGLAEEIDKDKLIMLLKGQIMAYEKALGVMGSKDAGETLKKNVG